MPQKAPQRPQNPLRMGWTMPDGYPPAILGVDPGFKNVGWGAIGRQGGRLVPVGFGVIRTEKSSAKREVRAADDNLRRAREIAHGLFLLMSAIRGGGDLWTPKVFCVESMSFPRNASSAAKVAMTWGVLATISEMLKMPLIQASPQEVRRALLGFVGKKASKEEVRDAVLKKLPALVEHPGWKELPSSLHEHVYDSFAVALACQDSEVVRMLWSL